MSEDWMRNLITSIPEIRRPEPQSHVDPVQLQTMLQENFDKVSNRIASVEAIAITQISLHKMVLRALLDLDLVKSEALTSGLERLKDEQAHEVSKQLLEGLIASFSEYGSQDEDRKPHLQLVPRTEEAPEK